MTLLREMGAFHAAMCGRGDTTAITAVTERATAGGGCCASLVGASRKGFIGQVLDEPDPLKRTYGNAATVCASVLAGVDIVRVHEVHEMRQVALLADEIHRGAAGGEREGAPGPAGRSKL